VLIWQIWAVSSAASFVLTNDHAVFFGWANHVLEAADRPCVNMHQEVVILR